jgi:hypothetical protein
MLVELAIAANLVMLAAGCAVILGSIFWLSRPVRMVNPF